MTCWHISDEEENELVVGTTLSGGVPKLFSYFLPELTLKWQDMGSYIHFLDHKWPTQTPRVEPMTAHLLHRELMELVSQNYSLYLGNRFVLISTKIILILQILLESPCSYTGLTLKKTGIGEVIAIFWTIKRPTQTPTVIKQRTDPEGLWCNTSGLGNTEGHLQHLSGTGSPSTSGWWPVHTRIFKFLWQLHYPRTLVKATNESIINRTALIKVVMTLLKFERNMVVVFQGSVNSSLQCLALIPYPYGTYVYGIGGPCYSSTAHTFVTLVHRNYYINISWTCCYNYSCFSVKHRIVKNIHTHTLPSSNLYSELWADSSAESGTGWQVGEKGGQHNGDKCYVTEPQGQSHSRARLSKTWDWSRWLFH